MRLNFYIGKDQLEALRYYAKSSDSGTSTAVSKVIISWYESVKSGSWVPDPKQDDDSVQGNPDLYGIPNCPKEVENELKAFASKYDTSVSGLLRMWISSLGIKVIRYAIEVPTYLRPNWKPCEKTFIHKAMGRPTSKKDKEEFSLIAENDLENPYKIGDQIEGRTISFITVDSDTNEWVLLTK